MTTPAKYRFDKNGRAKWLARLFAVKLPAWRGGKAVNHGDEQRFVRDIMAHHDRNAFRHAMEAVVDAVACYRERLSVEQRREILLAAAKVLGLTCEQPRARRRPTRGPRTLRRRAAKAVTK